MSTSPPVGLVPFGEFEADLGSRELRRQGVKLRLPDQSFQVLAMLLEHRGQLVPREEIHRKLWPGDTFVDFDHGLNNAVNRLREALGDSADAPRFVETLPRRGYRFVGAVNVSESGEQTPTICIPTGTKESGPRPSEPSNVRRIPIFWIATGTALLTVLTGLTFHVTQRGPWFGTVRSAPIHSIAVLPLQNLTGDPGQEYFVDGMTEALIGRLSGIHDLRVISRTSVMHFKDTKLSVPEIARTLRVDAIVEGSVIRERSRVRVTAQLIRGATDEHFWSEVYDRELQDTLALQSEVAQSIARKVEVTVTEPERARLVAARHVAPEVYESYLKGQFALDKSTSRTGVEESMGYFDEAIKKDPTFAPAYVGLAHAYDNLGTVYFGVPPDEVRPKLISAARKALELDPELAEAHLLLASVQQEQWQWTEAEAEYRRALDLNPSDAAARAGFAGWLLCQGRTEEALDWALRAREHDPLAVSGVRMGWILFLARRYKEAIEDIRGVLAMKRDDPDALWVLGFVLIANGQAEEAIPGLEKVVAVSDRSPGSLELLATAYAHAGRRREALSLIKELKRRQQTSYIPAGAFINPYLGLGDYDKAFASFDRAFQEKSNILQFLRVHPFFDPVRRDPRFAGLLRRVGLDKPH